MYFYKKEYGNIRYVGQPYLEAIIALPPLHLVINQEAQFFSRAVAAKELSFCLWRPPRVSHTEILHEAIGKVPLLEAVTDTVPRKSFSTRSTRYNYTKTPKEDLTQGS